MKEFYPKVSIIIPVYNGEKYIENAIHSALNQTYDNIEVIVVNDGSTDNTENIVKKFGDKIIYFSKENGGVSSALNLGIQHMSGEYFSWLSHDDEYYLNKIEREVTELNYLENKDTIIYSNYDMMTEIGDVYDTVIHNHKKLLLYPELSILNGCLNGLTLLIPKKAFDVCGLFDETLFCTQDYDKWLQMIKKFPFYHIQDVLTKTRLHSEQTTNTSSKVITEGNILWKKITRSFSQKRIIEIFGNIENYNLEMYRFFEKTPYNEMRDYFKKQFENKKKDYKFKPLVSVIIPVYNGANYVRNAIDSVLNQTYSNYELLVVNDGSTDNGETDKILKSYGKKIKYLKKENGGVASALNYGIKHSKGQYISWLSHDDVYKPFKLEKQIERLNELEDKNTIIFSNFELIDENSKVFAETKIENRCEMDKIELGIYPVLKGTTNGSDMLIPKYCFDKCGLFNEKTSTTNDYEMWFVLFRKFKCSFIKDNLISYRIHSQQDTQKSDKYLDECEVMWTDQFQNITDKEIQELGYSKNQFYYEFYIQMKESGYLKTANMLKEMYEQSYGVSVPSVSIIMPCYNSEKFLSKAIDSILNQTYGDFELICVDDNSNDNTAKILEHYGSVDNRIKIIHNSRSKGVAGAMNSGLEIARGEFITRMDSDDISLPNRISRQVSFLKNNADYGLCTVNINAMDIYDNADVNSLYVNDICPYEWRYLWNNPIPCAPSMYRKSMIQDELFDENLHTAEDYDFFIRFVDTNKYYMIDDVLYSYRIYDDSLFQKNVYLTLNNSAGIAQKYYKKVTGKNVPRFYYSLTDFSSFIEDDSLDGTRDVLQFLKETLNLFCNKFKWNEDEFDAAERHMYFIFENYINLKNQYSINKDSVNELRSVYNSTSWKLTKPIRLIGKYLKYMKHNGFVQTSKVVGKRVCEKVFK